MRARQVVYTWDYHHGQATRVIAGGLPSIRGVTMAEKQAYFAARCDHVRTSMMQEPRGHRNMLGAVLTDPVTPDGDVGMLFLTPQGFLAMCGDSTFSGAAAIVDAGIVPYADPDGGVELKIDTVAGRVDVHVALRGGEPVAVTFDNVPSYSLGEQMIDVEGVGPVRAMLGYGGLTYAFFEARALGVPSLLEVPRDELLDIGTRVLQSARAQTMLPGCLGPDWAGDPRPVDLVTLYEPLEGEQGARVANFYLPHTCGRTPSGTGLSARTAIEVAAGRLGVGDSFIQESLVGLRFVSTVTRTGVARADGGLAGIVPAVTARSYLMGTAQWILHPDDPFRDGFVF